MSKPLPPAARSEAPPSSTRLSDETSRHNKALKILTVLRDALNQDVGGLCCLDVGCASGLISYRMAEGCGHVVGLDPDQSALSRAPRRNNLTYTWGDALYLPFRTASLDLVVCAQVYEHVLDPARLFAEIRRVLRPDGLCFFSGPNRWAIVEAHYGLPFLHWLPPRAAEWYLRATGRPHSYEERPLTHGSLRQLVRGFTVQDYTVAMLRSPDRYFCREEIPFANWVRHVPVWAWRLVYGLLPNYNWVLRKRVAP